MPKAKTCAVWQKPLLDSWSSFRAEEGMVFDRSELTGSPKGMPPWSVRFETLHGGKQEGVDLIHVDNGRLSFVIIPTRGMGIFEAWYDNVRLGWDSPIGEIVNPAYINLEARNGLGWLEGFSEWMVRCGVGSNGAPAPGYTLHGRTGNTPASAVSVSVSTEKPWTISVSGIMREVCMFQENLLLETVISTEPGADWLRIEDRITNLSPRPAAAQMLYHFNYGPPLLEEGAKFVAPVDWVCSRDADADAARSRAWERYLPPTTGLGEACMYMNLKTDRKGQTLQMLQNAAGDLGVVQSYAHRSLPCFALWKNEAALDDGYVTGMEPCTNYPNPYPYEESKKRVVRLRSGASWKADITVAVADGKRAVQSVAKKVKSIQGRKKPTFLPTPKPGISPDGD